MIGAEAMPITFAGIGRLWLAVGEFEANRKRQCGP